MAKRNNTREAADQADVTITLAVPHTHGGERLKAGTQMTVSQDRALWMRRLGLIAPDANLNQTDQPTGE